MDGGVTDVDITCKHEDACFWCKTSSNLFFLSFTFLHLSFLLQQIIIIETQIRMSLLHHVCDRPYTLNAGVYKILSINTTDFVRILPGFHNGPTLRSPSGTVLSRSPNATWFENILTFPDCPYCANFLGVAKIDTDLKFICRTCPYTCSVEDIASPVPDSDDDNDKVDKNRVDNNGVDSNKVNKNKVDSKNVDGKKIDDTNVCR